MSSVQSPFAQAAIDAVAAATGVSRSELTATTPPRPELGDFAIGVFPAAKALKQPPPAVAARIAAEFVAGPLLASATATGPFMNFRVDRGAAFRWLVDGTLGSGSLMPAVGTDHTVCIDYSSPNISKHLAYHHIRSTVIGHALAEIHRALGYRVIGVNHLGDWGTTHGMLIAAYKKWPPPEGELDVTKLNELYVRFRAAIKDDPAVEQEGRDWFKKLESGDPEARELWTWFRDLSLAEFQSAYVKMGIHFDEIRGESAYEADLPGVLALLEAKGLLSESEGAQVVELEGEKIPFMVKTRDGTTLYGTRDIAAAMYRWNTYHFAKSLYVVDRGQATHFRQLFATLQKLGFDWADRCAHVPFGLIRLGGKKTSTRATGGDGNKGMLLKEVFAEATERVRVTIRENNPEMSEADLDATAQMVGIGAVVFANLVTQREKDIDFEWEKVLSLSGDSGPYLQYSHARCASILRKAGVTPTADVDMTVLTHDAEWAFARRLLDFGEVVAKAAANDEPHGVAHYLLDLCGEFSRWYTAGMGDPSLRAIVDDRALSAARLALVASCKHVLAQGLGLLGLRAPDVM